MTFSGAPLTDSDDALDWMGALPWSADKVGLIGCSSTAEWQLAVASRGNKALATFIPESFGAGVGRVGPYYEQGNWFRGGAVQMLFGAWLYDYGLETNDGRPNFPPGMSQEALVTAAKSYDLSAHPPTVDWSKALQHLPEKDILAAVGSPHGIYADTTPSGKPGMIARTPNDPSWYQGGLWNDSMRIDIPGLWLMTWYDISVAPNLAAYNYVRNTASPAVASQQYAIIAPVAHCSYKRAAEHTIVGERDLGDARLDYDALTYGWFDHFLKGRGQRPPRQDTKGPLLHHGEQQVAVVRHLAARRCEASYVLPGQRWPRQFPQRRWRSASLTAAEGQRSTNSSTIP